MVDVRLTRARIENRTASRCEGKRILKPNDPPAAEGDENLYNQAARE